MGMERSGEGFTDLNMAGIAVVLSPAQSGERSTMHKAEQQS